MSTRSNQLPKDEGLDISKLLPKIIRKWPLILLSVIVCLGLAYLYLRYTTPMFRISARVLVNDEKKGGSALGAAADALGDLGGLLGTKSTVDNEAEILQTRYLMEQVVKDMHLNITYIKKGRVNDIEIYKSPFTVQFVVPEDTIKATGFDLELLKNGKISLKSGLLDTVVEFNGKITFPKVGTFIITKTPGQLFVQDERYKFSIVSVDEKVAGLMNDLSVSVGNKLITVIDLSINHPIPKKGEDILTELIHKYVQGNIDDKNEVADSTIKFIRNRLAFISSELGDLEGNIQGFKQKNNLADMTEQSKLLVQNTSSFMNELSKVETQLSILSNLQEYLKDESGNRVLPSSILPGDMVFTGLIDKYNALLLDRDRRLLGVTETNPVITNLDKQIKNMRTDMLANLISTKNGLEITKAQLQGQMKSVEGQVQQIPATERNYLNLARQQQIKQELYIYLMQKSEETAISKTSNIANSRTIDPPKSEFKPFSPKKSVVALVGLFMGLAIPIGIIYLLDVLNNKINTKEDITEATEVPILGEISHSDDSANLAVSDNSRSAISEQFRALRTNLSFYHNENEKTKVILLTSSMSGEGKSFVAINLGNVLAITGKRVLLMELDLRKPGMSGKLNTSNGVGFTNYVVDKSLTAKDIVKPLDIHEDLFIVSSGPIPPNPAETLLNPRTKELIDELRTQFDYIIIDAPPIGIITDAQLLEPHADVCLYLVRHKFTLKNQLHIVDDLFRTKKMKKIGIVINDIVLSDSYAYGYGYGYGSYGEEIAKKGFWKRIFKG
ncbi:polysaccharide biosynthesis tyrosine autokinase [Pedobacter panaciterrae]|uniref:GumC family protein n=1 Tax=Pedobacter panaciterrae TaxID=363849 RepID=UPI00155D9889|nr:tyrosine-protein kinase [Pedobacter panaciterrae]NQX55192.1 polysaccharide biosynthesis tyrosine autokinase [Pedobacter panaciterrae]